MIGIDLGGTNMQFGVVTPDGRVLSRAKRKTLADEGEEAILMRLLSGVEEACKAAGTPMAEIRAVGIGAPGAVDPHRGLVLEAPNLRWRDMPLGMRLEDRLGRPVAVDNDVNVAIWGELQHGAGRGAREMLGVWVGTGVGGGLVLDGKLHLGHFFTAGEIGHMTVAPGNPPGLRTLENLCSRTAIVNRLTHMIEANADSIVPELVEGKLNKIKSRTLAEAYNRQDPTVRLLVDDAARRIGVVAGSLATLLSLERVVMGGGLTEAIGEPFVAAVRESVHEVVFPSALRSVIVVGSELEDNAGVIGAALLARDRLGSVQPA
ncbi:MAG: ROK family protein [Planctomycetota bacterium]